MLEILRIRNCVKLEELKKFGFRDKGNYLQKDTKHITYYIYKDTRRIEMLISDNAATISAKTICELNKANLVEEINIIN